jgi:(R,R)-butanediol dehydrogenase / meso-butanediol dehydrogenase / diacetyl reductase
MKALRFHGRNDLRLEEVPEPFAGPGEVKVEVVWCGVCGTDIHEYQTGPSAIPSSERAHPLTGGHFPLTLGHEFAGKVVELGSGADAAPIGSRVAVEPLFRCGDCDFCRLGEFNRCVQFAALGLHADGAFAQFIVVPDYMVHPIPAAVSLEAAALVEPIAVGWHAATRAGVGPGDTALVTGAGPIGLGSLIALRALGASRVFVSEIGNGARARAARELGADRVVDPQVDDVVATVLDETQGAGVDIAIDTAGVQPALDAAVGAVRNGGTVVSSASWEGPAEVDLRTLLVREIGLLGTLAYSSEFADVLASMESAGPAIVEALVTKRVALSEAIEGGFDELIERKDDHIKILVGPDRTADARAFDDP